MIPSCHLRNLPDQNNGRKINTMDQNTRYYILLEKLTREMVTPEQISVEAIYEDLQELCKLLRVSKGVTTFYNNLALERKGEGESVMETFTRNMDLNLIKIDASERFLSKLK